MTQANHRRLDGSKVNIETDKEEYRDCMEEDEIKGVGNLSGAGRSSKGRVILEVRLFGGI